MRTEDRGNRGIRRGFSPKQIVETLLDEIDDERARTLREELGRKRLIVSWQRDGERNWLARLSGPSCRDTIERTGRTRLQAIESATNVYETVVESTRIS